MLTRIVRMSNMSYLNIQNRSFGCALEVHIFLLIIKATQLGSFIKIWRVKCN